MPGAVRYRYRISGRGAPTSGPARSDLLLAFVGVVLAVHLVGAVTALLLHDVRLRDGWWIPALAAVVPTPVTCFVYAEAGVPVGAGAGVAAAAAVVAVVLHVRPPAGCEGADDAHAGAEEGHVS